MEYRVLDSSGTDDDNPPSHYNRGPVGVGRVSGNGRSFVGSAQYQRIHTDFESEIHNLEQIAYGAVLRAFKAQSDALSWEKEGVITELRKELRVSDDEHRTLLGEVNGDDLIRRIREWREAGGDQNVAPGIPQHITNQLPSPTIPGSRKRQKISLSGNQYGAPSQSLHSQSLPGSTHPLSSAGKWGPSSGIGGRRHNAVQPAFTPAKPIYQFPNHVSSGAPMDDPSEGIGESVVGRRVMIRWPADLTFYEAVITDYNPVDGRHSLVYESNTADTSLEWVDIKAVPQEDIRWLGDGPLTSRLSEAGGPNSGRGRPSSMKNPFAHEIRPSRNDATKEDSEEIEILHTGTLIKKVERVLDASHPDKLEIDKAKKLLKDHEQTLIEVIEKLADACDSDEEPPFSHGHPMGGRQNVEYHGPDNVGRVVS